MVKYTAKSVTLSKGQVQKLAKGKKVRLTNKALSGGNQQVYLTGQQLRKVETRLRKGVGADIGPFDAAQIKHNVQHGGSLWDSLKSAGRFLFDNVVKPGAKILYEEVGRPLFDEAKREGVKYLVNEGRSRAKNYFSKGQGLGIRKRGSKPAGKRGQHGHGFFDDIGNFFTKTVPSVAKTTYNDVLKPASQVILPIAKEVGKAAWDERDTLLPLAVEAAKARSRAGAGVKRRGKRGGMIGYTRAKQTAGSFRMP